jgi:DNA repair exonuclease SbcCD ATPase subunit
MKSILPWLAALALLGAAAFFFSSNRELAAEVTALRAESAQVKSLRAEVEQLKQNGSPVQAEEIARLRKQNEDVLKLRNENRQLRDATQQLEKQAQTAQAREQAARTQAQTAASQAQAALAQAQAREQQIQAARANAETLAPQQLLNACINNLRQIDGAKQQWALENRKTITDVPAEKDVAPYLKNAIPKCPGGGAYTLGAAGVAPTCSIPGHALPE